MVHELLASVLSSNILSSMDSLDSPPNSKTPLPSGDSAIALSARPNGKDEPVIQERVKN